MQTAKNSTVQKKKTSTKTVTIETSGEITKKKVKSGGSVILPVEVNKRGYTFLGWSTVPGQTCNPNVSGISENSGYEKYSSLSGEV